MSKGAKEVSSIDSKQLQIASQTEVERRLNDIETFRQELPDPSSLNPEQAREITHFRERFNQNWLSFQENDKPVILEENETVAEFYQQLVLSNQVEEKDFWQRYFYWCSEKRWLKQLKKQFKEKAISKSTEQHPLQTGEREGSEAAAETTLTSENPECTNSFDTTQTGRPSDAATITSAKAQPSLSDDWQEPTRGDDPKTVPIQPATATVEKSSSSLPTGAPLLSYNNSKAAIISPDNSELSTAKDFDPSAVTGSSDASVKDRLENRGSPMSNTLANQQQGNDALIKKGNTEQQEHQPQEDNKAPSTASVKAEAPLAVPIKVTRIQGSSEPRSPLPKEKSGATSETVSTPPSTKRSRKKLSLLPATPQQSPNKKTPKSPVAKRKSAKADEALLTPTSSKGSRKKVQIPSVSPVKSPKKTGRSANKSPIPKKKHISEDNDKEVLSPSKRSPVKKVTPKKYNNSDLESREKPDIMDWTSSDDSSQSEPIALEKNRCPPTGGTNNAEDDASRDFHDSITEVATSSGRGRRRRNNPVRIKTKQGSFTEKFDLSQWTSSDDDSDFSP